MSGPCLDHVWAITGPCLGHVWAMSGRCLGLCLPTKQPWGCPIDRFWLNPFITAPSILSKNKSITFNMNITNRNGSTYTLCLTDPDLWKCSDLLNSIVAGFQVFWCRFSYYYIISYWFDKFCVRFFFCISLSVLPVSWVNVIWIYAVFFHNNFFLNEKSLKDICLKYCISRKT